MKSLQVEPLRSPFVPAKQGAKRHYGIHPYFTKRAWNVVQEYIKHFSSPGDTVLDPFGGSGVTAVESLVLRRKAVYADISEWACFLARQTAIAPVDMGQLAQAFAEVERRCRSFLEELWRTPDAEIEAKPVQDWYPKDVPLPKNSDVTLVEDLFTPRMLHGLARLRACIEETEDERSRDLLRMAFSATLARINRTFLSAEGRRESRGGSAVFSIYRYKVAERPVELPLWEQFNRRVTRLIEAKRETNQLIGDFYRDGRTATFRHASVSRLHEWIKPGSVDYVYTDPPYGGHIAYLDLSTMWAAWLGLDISSEDQAEEIIEGGELRKSRETYAELMKAAIAEMAETLKKGAWMSLVFAHRDTTYWEVLTDAARVAGLDYVNTVVQPVGVVWSMHKKKNPLRVLSGELILNFRKVSRIPARQAPSPQSDDPVRFVLQCCEKAIVTGLGATTEDLHHVTIPELLEARLLTRFSEECPDLTPLLESHFDFDATSHKWQLRKGQPLCGQIPGPDLARYYVLQFLAEHEEDALPPTADEVILCLRGILPQGTTLDRDQITEILRQSATTHDESHWRLPEADRRQLLLFP